MKFVKRLLPLLFLLCLLCGCAGAEQQREFFAMDTVMQLRAWGAAAALDQAQKEIERLARIFSCEDAQAELSRVNAGEPAASEELRALTKRALALSAQTWGAYQPALRPAMLAWGFPTGEYRVPDEAELQALQIACSVENVTVSDREIRLARGAQLDLGGLAKGYAAQRAAELLKAAGVQSAILSLGGNVTALGARPDGSDWQVGLQDPQNAAACFGILRLQDRSVVTSGGYQRYFEQDGVRYSHILDPETLRCAESGLLSATAVCSDGTLADALSTALYVLGLEDGIALWRQGGLDFEAVWMTDAREIYVTAGLAAAFQSELPFEVVSR